MCIALALGFIGGFLTLFGLVYYASPDWWYKPDGPQALLRGLSVRRWYVAAAVAVMAVSLILLKTAC